MRIEVKLTVELDDAKVAATGTKHPEILMATLGTLLENVVSEWWSYSDTVNSFHIESKQGR